MESLFRENIRKYLPQREYYVLVKFLIQGDLCDLQIKGQEYIKYEKLSDINKFIYTN